MLGNNDTYRIFIDNKGFVNKGDQLMIQSVLEQIRLYRLDAQVLLHKDAFMLKNHYQIPPNILQNLDVNREWKNMWKTCGKQCLADWIFDYQGIKSF